MTPFISLFLSLLCLLIGFLIGGWVTVSAIVKKITAHDPFSLNGKTYLVYEQPSGVSVPWKQPERTH